MVISSDWSYAERSINLLNKQTKYEQLARNGGMVRLTTYFERASFSLQPRKQKQPLMWKRLVELAL